MKSNKILFEVQRDPGIFIILSLLSVSTIRIILDDDDIIDEDDPSAGRFIQYRFPSTFLKLKQVGAL